MGLCESLWDAVSAPQDDNRACCCSRTSVSFLDGRAMHSPPISCCTSQLVHDLIAGPKPQWSRAGRSFGLADGPSGISQRFWVQSVRLVTGRHHPQVRPPPPSIHLPLACSGGVWGSGLLFPVRSGPSGLPLIGKPVVGAPRDLAAHWDSRLGKRLVRWCRCRQ